MKRLIILSTIVLTLSASQSHAQLNLNTFSVNVGATRTFFPSGFEYSKYQYAFYPELRVGGDFLTSYFQWTAYLGFWDDGIDHALPDADMVTYSYQTWILGGRINFNPYKTIKKMLPQTGIFVGIANHFISMEYVGGFGYDGKPGKSQYLNSSTFEFGLKSDLFQIGRVYIQGEVLQYFPLDNKYIDTRQENRRSYKVGLAYIL